MWLSGFGYLSEFYSCIYTKRTDWDKVLFVFVDEVMGDDHVAVQLTLGSGSSEADMPEQMI